MFSEGFKKSHLHTLYWLLLSKGTYSMVTLSQEQLSQSCCKCSPRPPPQWELGTVSFSQRVCSHEFFFSSCSACSRNNFTERLRNTHVITRRGQEQAHGLLAGLLVYWLNQAILLGSLAILWWFFCGKILFASPLKNLLRPVSYYGCHLNLHCLINWKPVISPLSLSLQPTALILQILKAVS